MTAPWLDLFLGHLYPPTCVLCGAPGHGGLDLCRGCRADLPHNSPACPRCAIQLPPGQTPGTLCGPCQRRPPPFTASHAAFRYQDPIPALVSGVKFHARFNLARLLGQCLSLALLEQGAERPEIVLPVPLHRPDYAAGATTRPWRSPARSAPAWRSRWMPTVACGSWRPAPRSDSMSASADATCEGPLAWCGH